MKFKRVTVPINQNLRPYSRDVVETISDDQKNKSTPPCLLKIKYYSLPCMFTWRIITISCPSPNKPRLLALLISRKADLYIAPRGSLPGTSLRNDNVPGYFLVAVVC